jgi:formylglycine-generating enzyme required for sulfatase activity
MKFVRLPKGTFFMGWDGSERPAKKTEITEDFEVAVHPVTQGQWQELMGNNPSFFSRTGGKKDRVKDVPDEDLKQFPVEGVSWEDAQEFVKKLNEREGGRGWRYRLPTEAEWEYACRGGATSEEDCCFHFYFDRPTNDLSSDQANFDGQSPFGAAGKGTNLGRQTKVGSYRPNRLGLYDMHGNVWHWCADIYQTGRSEMVLRGGGWNCDGSHCRTASRGWGGPSERDDRVGFRLVRVRSGGN